MKHMPCPRCPHCCQGRSFLPFDGHPGTPSAFFPSPPQFPFDVTLCALSRWQCRCLGHRGGATPQGPWGRAGSPCRCWKPSVLLKGRCLWIPASTHTLPLYVPGPVFLSFTKAPVSATTTADPRPLHPSAPQRGPQLMSLGSRSQLGSGHKARCASSCHAPPALCHRGQRGVTGLAGPCPCEPRSLHRNRHQLANPGCGAASCPGRICPRFCSTSQPGLAFQAFSWSKRRVKEL